MKLRRGVLTILVSAGILVCALIAAQTAPEKPLKRHSIHVDGGIAPASLDELWAASSLVVEVVVTGLRPNNTDGLTIGGTKPAPLPRTLVECVVLRILKSDGQVRPGVTALNVWRIGGRIDRGNHIDEYYDKHFPPFKPNHRYVLFLKAGSAEIPYWPVTNDGTSAYELRDERVIPYGTSPTATALGRLTASQFVELLNELGERR